MSVTQAFDGIAEVLAELDPSKVVELKAPEAMSKRVEELINKKKEGNLSV